MADAPTPPADAPPPAEPPAPQEPPTPPPAAEDAPLGPEGEKALQIWKDRAKAAEADAKRAKDLEAELDKLRTDQLSDHDKAIKDAADAARAETMSEVTARLFASELRGAARADIKTTDVDGNDAVARLSDPDLFADPEVAIRLLGLDEIPVTESGDIDTEAISDALAALVKAKPYLASATPAGDEQPYTPIDLGQGARGSTPQTEMDPQKLASRVRPSW